MYTKIADKSRSRGFCYPLKFYLNLFREINVWFESVAVPLETLLQTEYYIPVKHWDKTAWNNRN